MRTWSYGQNGSDRALNRWRVYCDGDGRTICLDEATAQFIVDACNERERVLALADNLPEIVQHFRDTNAAEAAQERQDEASPEWGVEGIVEARVPTNLAGS